MSFPLFSTLIWLLWNKIDIADYTTFHRHHFRWPYEVCHSVIPAIEEAAAMWHGMQNYGSIGSDNGLSPIWRQAIIYTNAWMLLIAPLGTNSSEIVIQIKNASFMKMHLKISSAKWLPFWLGGDKLMAWAWAMKR